MDIQNRFTAIKKSLDSQQKELLSKIDIFYKAMDEEGNDIRKRLLQREFIEEVVKLKKLKMLELLMFKLFEKDTLDPINTVVEEAATTYMKV